MFGFDRFKKEPGERLSRAGKWLSRAGEWLSRTGKWLSRAGGKQHIHEREEEPPKKEISIRLSLLVNYLNKYNLSPLNEESFFKLRKELLRDGKNLVIQRLNEVIKTDTPYNECAERIIDIYDELVNKEEKLDLAEGVEDPESPTITRYAISSYIKEFHLEELAESDVKATFFRVLNKLYDKGKKQMLNKIKPNVGWLKKYRDKDESEGIKEEIDRIIKKIREEE